MHGSDVAVSHVCTIPPDLEAFYAIPENFAVLRAVNGGAPPISLRALAWFVVNGVEDERTRDDYERNLRELTRRRFDPFRRCERMELRNEAIRDAVMTTIGQMNFFKWMIECGLWRFVTENRARVCALVARSVGHPPRSKTAAAVAAETAAAVAATKSRANKATSDRELTLDRVPVGISPGFARVSGRHVVVFD